MSELKCPVCAGSQILGPTLLSVQGIPLQYPSLTMSFTRTTRDPTQRPAIVRERLDVAVGAASVCLDCGHVALRVVDEVRARLRQAAENLEPIDTHAA